MRAIPSTTHKLISRVPQKFLNLVSSCGPRSDGDQIDPPKRLNARVILEMLLVIKVACWILKPLASIPLIPVPASFQQSTLVVKLYTVCILENLHCETGRCVPGDMAVH
jgi:hypothetical protein